LISSRTVHGIALTLIVALVLANEELEVVVGVFDGADLVRFVDVVSMIY
jgi:hypothetical protein